MGADFIMPKLGLTMEEGTVVRWLAAEGDQVAAGEVILEVQTDKVTVEVEAPAEGVLGELQVREGETVPIGTVLARIGNPQEASAERPRITPLARRVAAEEGIDLVGVLERGHDRITVADVRAIRETEGKRFSSPRARKRARETGIDWRSVTGTGPRGRVIERDVLATVDRAPGPAVAASDTPPASFRPSGDSSGTRGVLWEEPTPVQRVAAQRTTEAFTSTPALLPDLRDVG